MTNVMTMQMHCLHLLLWETWLTDSPNCCPSKFISHHSNSTHTSCGLLPSNDWVWQSNMYDSSNVDLGSRTATSLAKSLLDFCCSLRLFLPNSQSLPLFYYSCQTYITIWSLPSHSTASLSSKSCACATLFRYLLLCGSQLMQVVPRVVWENK